MQVATFASTGRQSLKQVAFNHLPLVNQLRAIIELSEPDAAAIATLPINPVPVSAGVRLAEIGAARGECVLVLSGLIASYKDTGDGRRQILSFDFPGDLSDLRTLHLPVRDYSLLSLTNAVIARIPFPVIERLMKAYPGVEHAMLRQGAVYASIERQWHANTGRRNALERVAHLLCETNLRLKARGLITAGDLPFVPPQADLADATGLSNVHLNRTFQELRRAGLLKSEGRKHTLPDVKALAAIAGFDPGYLHLRRPFEAF